ncbi:MAG: glycosyltransferase [Candidatus Omnitrophica bacterium]|nr:glycosyltransferase [Candidatus Omnitrophota bacterium]
MFDWFERIDYGTSDVIIIVTTGWNERFLKEARQRCLPIKVEELPFDYFKIGPIKRFFDMVNFLKNYRPSGIIFFQAHFEEFGLPELLPALWKAKGNVFMHENTGSLKAPARTSKKHFGLIPGAGLWWQYYMFCIKFRAYVTKKILAVSQEIKNRYTSWWGYPVDKIQVFYHGVDSKNFSPDPDLRINLRHKLNLPDDAKILIMVARFTPLKRIDRAIRAFNIIFMNRNDIHLVLVGSGPLENECRQLAASLPSFQYIHFIGHVNNPADYLKMADIFVLSSDNEGLSIALMEAMACGLIAVSTDCSGSSELITEGRTGFMVTKSAESLADGIRKALCLSPAESQNMKRSAVRLIREQFDIDNNVQKVFKTMGITEA